MNEGLITAEHVLEHNVFPIVSHFDYLVFEEVEICPLIPDGLMRTMWG